MTIMLKASTGTEVGDYHLECAMQGEWFLCWYDHNLGADKTEHDPKRGRKSQVYQNGRKLSRHR